MQKITFLILVTLFIFSCDSSHNAASNLHENLNLKASANADDGGEIKATFVHTVFFWMKENLSEKEASFFESEMEKLGKTPSILSYKWGKPAGTPREVVDNSYTYAWIVDFASSEDQNAYQIDPIHLAFIDNCKDLWTKVQVYDTLVK